MIIQSVSPHCIISINNDRINIHIIDIIYIIKRNTMAINIGYCIGQLIDALRRSFLVFYQF